MLKTLFISIIIALLGVGAAGLGASVFLVIEEIFT